MQEMQAITIIDVGDKDHFITPLFLVCKQTRAGSSGTISTFVNMTQHHTQHQKDEPLAHAYLNSFYLTNYSNSATSPRSTSMESVTVLSLSFSSSHFSSSDWLDSSPS